MELYSRNGGSMKNHVDTLIFHTAYLRRSVVNMLLMHKPKLHSQFLGEIA